VWISWRPKGRPGLRCTSSAFSKGQRVPSLPTNAQPVLVRRLPQQHEVQVPGVATLWDDTAEDTQPTTFIERLEWFRIHNPKDAWILDELELVGDHSHITRSINYGTACTISNGSFKDKSVAAAFTITCPKTKAAYTGKHTVQGPPTANSAYRSKLSGILGILTLANLLCVHDGINLGGVTLACDGLSTLQQSFYDGPAVVTRPDFDLIHTLCHHLKVSQLKWISQQVNGHQEDIKEWAKL
jgi:hypothetical protein